jgi:hypothetical protein
LGQITEHLGGIFRHMLPGILVVSCAKLAYPTRLNFEANSWPHLLVIGAVSIAVGNAWFALNRYGVHQTLDYFLYLIKSKGPARGNTRFTYLDDLGRYTYRSLHTADSSARARQHVGFRASTVLLALTVGELLITFAWCHEPNSIFGGHPTALLCGGALALIVGGWQMVITRRIDYFIVNPPEE